MDDGGFAEWGLERLYGWFYDRVENRYGKGAALVMAVMLAMTILAIPVIVLAFVL